MSLDPIKIPQNVYIEDRIVGPLTLRQVLTVAIGGGFSYALWSMVAKAYGNVPIPIVIVLWIPAALSAAFAFIKINDLSLMRIVLLMIEQMEKPKKRVWAPRQGIIINIRTFTTPTMEKAKGPEKSMEPIDRITRALDASPFPKSSMMAQAPAVAVAEPEVDAGPGFDADPAAPSEAPEERRGEPATYRRPVNPQRIAAEPLRADAGVDGIGTSVTVAIPRNSIFRDLSPAA